MTRQQTLEDLFLSIRNEETATMVAYKAVRKCKN